MTVQNLPDEVQRARRVCAASNGRTTEPEICDILEPVVKPAERVCMGDTLHRIARELSLTEEDMVHFERDMTPAEPMSFE